MSEGGEISKINSREQDLLHYEEQVMRLENIKKALLALPETQSSNESIEWIEQQIAHHQTEIEKIKRRTE